MSKAEGKGYAQLLDEHYKDYSRLFNRVSLNLNDVDNANDMPIDQRLANYRKGAKDFYLEQLYYQFGRYLLIASSRPGNMPANLQGVWHNNVDGPWRVDYHNNINLQMNYWPACTTNLSECELPLFDFIQTQVKPGEKTAKSYYGTRWLDHICIQQHLRFHLSIVKRGYVVELSPFAGPWLATHLWDYYDYTRDKKFLSDMAYDIIKGSANFATDYLWHRKDGVYTAALPHLQSTDR